MRAARLKSHANIGELPLSLDEISRPLPGNKELLIRVSACALCRTDLHVIEGELSTHKLPIIPGHQIVGVVEQLGAGCSRFTVGERVGVAWLRWTCGQCVFCSHEQENLCEESRYTGYHDDGGFAEYTSVHEDYAYKIPAVFSDREAAPLLCAGIIGYRALKRSQLPDRGSLALFGFGSSAHITIQLAVSRGCTVYVATRNAAHRELALSLGAVWAGTTQDRLPRLVDSAIIFAPVGDIVPLALQAVRKGGCVVCAGIHMSPIPVMNYEQTLFHEKDLRSVEANTRLDGEEFLAEAACIPIRPRTTIFTLDQINEALVSLKSDQLSGTGVIKFS